MTTVPQSILDALPEPIHAADVLGWAAVGAAPGTSLGETHLLVTRRATYALSRPTPWEPLVPLNLAAGAWPRLVTESFETWLVLPLEGRGDARVPLTQYDIKTLDPVIHLIAEQLSRRAAGESSGAEHSGRAGEALDGARPEPAPPGASPIPPMASPAPAVAGIGASFEQRIDRALDTLQQVGRRAAAKGAFPALDVRVRVDDVEVSVRFDRAALARLADAE